MRTACRLAWLIMQQLCMNKFVSPGTGATIQLAQFGIMPALVFVPAIGLIIAMVIAQDTDYVLLHEQWLKDHAAHHKK